MKSKLGVLMVLSLMAASAAYSQVENDDMYFTSKDRARLVSARPVSFATVAQADDAQLGTTGNTVNPTDSYSGRGENPEYSAASAGQNGAPQYFVSNYQPTGVNQSLCNTCSGYNSPYYGNNNYYNGMNSMYGYGNPYSSMGMYGMGYPSYGMGMNYGMGYGMGMNYGMGYGMGYGSYGMGYGSYGMGYGMGMNYGMGYGSYGMGYGGGYGYYPSALVIVDHGNSSSYGRRGSRSSTVNNSSYYNSRSNSGTGSGTSGRVSQIGGRASNQSMNSQYYERGWKSNPNIVTGSSSGGSTPSRSSFWGNSGSNNSGYSNMGSGTRSNWGGSGSGSGNTGRSSFGGGSSGGGGFSSGGGGGGSSGGGGGGRGRH